LVKVCFICPIYFFSVHFITCFIYFYLEWSHSQLVTFSIWSNLIERNFEKYFFVDGTYTSTDVDPHPELINKHNIYKDLVGSSTAWTDYQLRPNFPIAIVVVRIFTSSNITKSFDTFTPKCNTLAMCSY